MPTPAQKKAIDFSDLGGKVVQPAQAQSVDFSDLGGVRVEASSSAPQQQSPGYSDTGVWSGLKRAASNVIGLPYDVAHEVLSPPRTPEEVSLTAGTGSVPGGTPLVLGVKRLIVDPLQKEAALSRNMYKIADRTGNEDARHLANMHAIASGVPVVGPIASDLTQRYLLGDKSGAITEGAAYIAAPKLTEKALNANVRAPFRGSMAGRMNQLAPGEQFTRQQILDASRARGINLDLADATGSGAARGVKAYSERSIGGKGTMRANTETNLQKLGDWADEHLSTYAPESTPREVLGGQMQGALEQDLGMRKTAAQTAFDDLDKRVGSNPVDATKTIQDQAQKILYDNKEYYQKHPELAPAKAIKIVEDLAKGNSYSWSELHQLRSDLLEFTRNNPDIVKGRAEGWIQKLTGDIDQAMTNEATSKLKPADLEQFRKANELWSGIKDTYDNPQSPLYHAVRSQYPSQVPGMLTKATPELAQQVRTVMGDLEGPLQRHVVESLLTDKSGNLDLKNLNSRLSRVPNDYLSSILGKDGARELRMLGKVAQKVTVDVNPSGTAAAMIPYGEVGAASTMLLTNPLAAGATLGGELATGYGTARGLTSPGVVDYLTRKPIRARGGAVRVPNTLAGLAGVSGGKKRK